MIRVLVVVSILSSLALAQGDVYHGVAVAPNGLDAWVVNIESVAIYHTGDFGMSWEPQTMNTTRRLFGVFFLDSQRGWTCGDIGAIHATTDGGGEWFRQNLGGPKYASRIQFIDSLYGWSSGGTAMMLFTRDGGASWSMDFFPATPFPQDTVDFQGLSFVDSATGWLAAGRYPEEDTLGNPTFTGGQGYIARVEAGGDTFRHILQLKDTVNDFFDIEFTDAMNGWVVGGEDIGFGAAVLHTTNGGTDWVAQSVPAEARLLRGVDFVSPNQGWACGRSGTIIHTSDGGASWEIQPCMADTTLFDIEFADSLRGMIAGNSVVLYTTDGGASWVRGFGGIEEAPGFGINPARGLSVMPNPCRVGGSVRLSLGTRSQTSDGSVMSLRIYDTSGRLVLQSRTGSRGPQIPLDLRGLSPGLYFVRADGNGITETAPLVLLAE